MRDVDLAIDIERVAEHARYELHCRIAEELRTALGAVA
jgi:hypothetical protein